MANWCMNTVEFVGEPAQLERLRELFDALAEKEKIEGCAQKPDFITDPDRFFFEIRWDEDMLYYETKWAPNTSDIKQIAEYFQVGFIYQYEESAMEIFGEATYINGILTDLWLDQEDYSLIEILDDDTGYLFEGELWGSQQEILELLLERKKSNILG